MRLLTISMGLLVKDKLKKRNFKLVVDVHSRATKSTPFVECNYVKWERHKIVNHDFILELHLQEFKLWCITERIVLPFYTFYQYVKCPINK